MQWKLVRPAIFMVMAPLVASAQTPTPANAAPAVAPPTGAAYRSAFADYQPYTEPVMMSWREANDQVRDTGSMHGHGDDDVTV